ncbi:MAG: MarR family winged helix-turn-helix transcriptional regulator [Thermoanaerobaculia bacterium]
MALLRASDIVRRYFTAIVEPFGITLQQFNVLRILRGAGEAGLPTLEIVERMIETTPGITRLLDRLEAKRLVRRERCSVDRRQVLCWITEEGRAVLARLDTTIEEADRAVVAGLRKPELETLVLYLDTISTKQR